MTKTAFYAGSFDPPTNGHVDVIARSMQLADVLVIGVGVHHQKAPFLPAEKRVDLLEKECASLAAGHACEIRVTTFDGLVVDAARVAGADFMVRGLRNGTDYEYEAQMNGMNTTMAPDVETVYLAASPHVSFISSTLVRQIATMGGDIAPFAPDSVVKSVKAHLSAN